MIAPWCIFCSKRAAKAEQQMALVSTNATVGTWNPEANCERHMREQQHFPAATIRPRKEASTRHGSGFSKNFPAVFLVTACWPSMSDRPDPALTDIIRLLDTRISILDSTRLKTLASLVVFLAALTGGVNVRAAEDTLPEYQLKALFLYNFAKFVDWPSGTFAETNSPIIVGVLGKDRFGPYLHSIAEGQPLNGHPFVVRSYATVNQARECHILFIGDSEAKKLDEILKILKGLSVLTVSDIDDFARRGGMIQFIQAGGKVRFAINNAAARAARLRISSQLLNLATEIVPAPPASPK
jgi:hypothetical protein